MIVELLGDTSFGKGGGGRWGNSHVKPFVSAYAKSIPHSIVSVSHPLTLSLSLFLSVSLCICLSVYLSVSLSFSLSLSLSLFLSLFLSLSLSVCLPVSLHLFFCLSVSFSVPPTPLSLPLSFCLFLFFAKTADARKLKDRTTSYTLFLEKDCQYLCFVQSHNNYNDCSRKKH